MLIKTSQTRFSFSMKLFREILKVYLEKALLIQYCMIEHLIFPKASKCDGYQHRLNRFLIKGLPGCY